MEHQCLLSDQIIQPPPLSPLFQDRDLEEVLGLILSIHANHSRLLTTYFMTNKRGWVSTLLMLRPFSKAPHVLLTISRNIIFLRCPYCNLWFLNHNRDIIASDSLWEGCFPLVEDNRHKNGSVEFLAPSQGSV